MSDEAVKDLALYGGADELPDFDDDMSLDDILGVAAGVETENYDEEVAEIPRVNAYISLPQGTSANHPRKTRGTTMYVSWQVEPGKFDGAYFEKLLFLMVDRLTQRVPTGNGNRTRMAGGLLKWPYKPDGQRDLEGDGPDCSSPNGIVPFRQYIGKKGIDHRTGLPYMIGGELQPDGSFLSVPAEEVCYRCPLSNWINGDGEDRQAALCKSAWEWVVWLPPQEGKDAEGNPKMIGVDEEGRPVGLLARWRGANPSVQTAMQGKEANPKKPNEWGLGKGNVTLHGIEKFFEEDQNILMPMPINARLGAQQWKLVVGLASKLGKKNAVEDYVKSKPDSAAFRERVDSGEFTHYVLSVPVSAAYPNGKPEVVGSYKESYFVAATVMDNNNAQNPTAVPQFARSDEQITEEGYKRFLMAYLGSYVKQEMRKNMLNMGMIEDVRLAQAQVFAPRISVGMPATAGALTAGEDYVDADVIPADLPLDD